MSSLGAFLLLFLWAFQPKAEIKLTVDGATRSVIGPNTLSIYAGFAYQDGLGPSDYGCAGAPCNTCATAKNPFAPCSFGSLFLNTNLSITANIDKPVSGSTWGVCAGSGATPINVIPVVSGNTMQWTAPWSQVCTAMSSSGCASTSAFSSTLYVAYGSTPCGTAATGERREIKVFVSSRVHASGTTSESAVTAATEDEAYDFALFPGDGKAYIKTVDDDPVNNYKVGASFPRMTRLGTQTGLSWKKLVFFYSESSDIASSNVGVTSQSKTLEIQTGNDSTGSLLRDYINELENDVSYCFRLANEDEAGVIGLITPSTATDSTKYCVTPKPVIGALGDKKCFIATAAYGSPMDPRVQSFRSFRDTFLLPYGLGREFVQFYYRTSPPFADLISNSEALKFFVRILLWPVLGIAEVLLLFGFWIGGFLILVGIHLGLRISRQVSELFRARNKMPGSFVVRSVRLCDVQGGRLRAPLPLSSAAGILLRALRFKSLFGFLLFFFPLKAVPQADLPPQEPPYTQGEENIEAQQIIDLNESPRNAQNPEASFESQKVINRNDSPRDQFVDHPGAKKGLYLIDSSGVYHYRLPKPGPVNSTYSMKVFSVPPPDIQTTLDNGESFSFEDMYGGDNLSIFTLDWDWSPFKSMRQVFINFGFGFFTASGQGFFKSGPLNADPPKETYKFFGVPATVGVGYKFIFSDRQWFIPYARGGGLLYGLVELRDDGKQNNFTGTPGFYGAGGVEISLTSWNQKLSYTMKNEYNLKNLSLIAEFRALKTTKEDLDFSSTSAGFGFSASY